MIEASSILGKKIFVLTAHPDDESFLAAGTIFANNQSGGQTFLVCSTLGEKGKSHLRQPMSEKELQIVRRSELKKTCSLLKIDQVYVLDFPDGGVENHHPELTERVSALIANLEPELIMSFGSDGITGHNDHIAINKIAAHMAKKYQLPLATFCIPSEVAEHAHKWLHAKQVTKEHYAKRFELIKENICIPIDPKIKMKALECYDSQIDNQNPFAGWPDYIAKILLEKECFLYADE